MVILGASWAGAGRVAEAPATGLANVWVDPDSGSCRRTPKARAYVSAQACGTVQLAAAAAADGDVVLVRDGTYPGVTLAGNAIRLGYPIQGNWDRVANGFSVTTGATMVS